MEIVEGFIAVLLPFMVAICPKDYHWIVKIYDGTKATSENREAATTLHWQRKRRPERLNRSRT